MKYNELEFKNEVAKLYNGEIEVVSIYKGLTKPILVKDKYGVLNISLAHLVLKYRPTIKAALNKTEYFMALLREDTSTETFTNELLPLIKENLIYDIVSTSDESQSSDELQNSNTDSE